MNTLSDNGATNSCFTTLDMAVKGTKEVYNGPPIQIGKEQAELQVASSHIFLSRVTDDVGNEWGVMQKGFYTPNAICNIESEPANRKRGDCYIDNVPSRENMRVKVTKAGDECVLQMSSNGLGWLNVQPLDRAEALRVSALYSKATPAIRDVGVSLLLKRVSQPFDWQSLAQIRPVLAVISGAPMLSEGESLAKLMTDAAHNTPGIKFPLDGSASSQELALSLARMIDGSRTGNVTWGSALYSRGTVTMHEIQRQGQKSKWLPLFRQRV